MRCFRKSNMGREVTLLNDSNSNKSNKNSRTNKLFSNIQRRRIIQQTLSFNKNSNTGGAEETNK